MKWTNIADLPQPLVSAIQFSDYERVGDISVTELPGPPRIRQLRKRHDEEITEDVSEGIWRMIGSVGHKVVERADTDNHLAEERMTFHIRNWTISGKADLLSPDMTLDDYKFLSVWAIKESKPEYEAQLNLYAFLYRQHGFEVRRARIIGVLRDWSKLRAKCEPDYPQVGVVVREVPLWSYESQWAYLTERVLLHQEAELLPDDELPLCTDEERWKKPDTWAVKKKGNKRALRLFNNEIEANEYATIGATPGMYGVEHRPGSYPRCESYCPVAQFCNQWAKVKKQAAPSDEEPA